MNAASSSGRVPRPFTIVMLPDTQSYIRNPALAPIFEAQTAWIAAHRDAEAIAFVTHVGDVVQNGALGRDRNAREWRDARAAIERIGPRGAGIPFSVVPGNHDYDAPDSKVAAERYAEAFAADSSMAATDDGLNTAHLFLAATSPTCIWDSSGAHRTTRSPGRRAFSPHTLTCRPS